MRLARCACVCVYVYLCICVVVRQRQSEWTVPRYGKHMFPIVDAAAVSAFLAAIFSDDDLIIFSK